MMDWTNYFKELERKADQSKLTNVKHLKLPVRMATIIWRNLKELPFSLTCYPLRHMRFITDKGNSWEVLLVVALWSDVGVSPRRRNYCVVDKVKTEKLPPMILRLSLANPIKSSIRTLFESKDGVYDGEALRIVYHGGGSFDVFIVEDLDKFDEFAVKVKEYMGDLLRFKKELRALPNPTKQERVVDLYQKIFMTELIYYATALRQAGEELQEELPEDQNGDEIDEISL